MAVDVPLTPELLDGDGATKDTHAVGAETGANVEESAKAAPARSPVTIQGYVRPPGRDILGLTRAHRDEPEAPTPASAPPLAPMPLPAADGAGIIRAHHDEAGTPAEPALPAPLFSNEGMVRQAEVRRRSRSLGPIAGVFGALLVSGTALGHSLGSHLPGAKTAATGRSLSPLDSGSPAFDRSGESPLKDGRRRKAAGAMLLAGLLGVAVIGFAPAAALPLLPSNTVSSRSPGVSSNIALGDASTQPGGSSTPDPSAAPSGVLVGDDPLDPDAMRPTAEPGTPGTPMSPTSTPVPTSPPTPTPTPAVNFVVFEPAGSTKSSNTATYSVPQGTNFTFIIDGLGGARCTLSSNPHRAGAPRSQTVPGTAPQVNSIILTTWGDNWPAGAYTVTATCTLAGRPTATATQMVYIN